MALQSFEKWRSSNEMSADTRKVSIEALQCVLACLIDLTGRCHHAHWNVRGPHFAQLHEVFGEAYGAIGGQVDSIAERIIQLGGYANGLLAHNAGATKLEPFNEEVTGLGFAESLKASLSQFAGHVRPMIDATMDAGDQVTGDMLIALMTVIDKQLWLVEAHLAQS